MWGSRELVSCSAKSFSQKTCTGGLNTPARSTPTRFGDEGWHEGTTKTTIRAENEVEAHREANNYKVYQDFHSSAQYY